MKWYEMQGKNKDVVISSRVRLARNIEGYPFPTRLDEKGAQEIISKVREAFGNEYTYTDLTALSPLEIKGYIERQEISTDMAKAKGPHGLLTSDKNGVSIMVCEEDHMRLQCVMSGLALREAYELVAEADDKADSALDIAFDEKLGYLTHCPTNLGTGMRASVMVFLPGMTMSRQIQSLSSQLQKLGLTVRGMYGEGSAADGCIYQISNQVTLGITEEETLDKLSNIIDQIVVSERQLRESIIKSDELCDRIARAEGVFRYAKMISSSEFMKLYADLRLGVSTDIIRGISYEKLDSLLVNVMPANLMLDSEQLSADEKQRDKLRAEKIRTIIG
ncbi:MAG: ATP--guanido phosphotransferase [Clostridia bacterium]|nr:ATP--guanido phosphotransferase [Clostridia bacterium]